ncbi:cytochrome P450 [Suillus clintonianus]|uniref:cytochrome P450 n=1 Tax=Suillus clintonianus TaxID=1904413 RepID=UPI001B861202|nr:cytochrome P450 [Suillus clintonianus]KAG2146815.1 cytochrome P450 [Suillus clintonianus]
MNASTIAITSTLSIWTTVRSVGALNVAGSFTALWAFVKVLRALRWRLKTTQLRGPPRTSFVYGVSHDLESSHDSSAMYEQWATRYGVAYMIPSVLGQTTIVLCDPKAIAHFYARETWTYAHTPIMLTFLEVSIGRGLMWSHGENHRRQRKALTPAFTNAAIRKLTSVFYDSAYKAKGAWDTAIESSKDGNAAVIEVQNWMNHISLDTVGIAGFSHDFGSLDGQRASVTEVFDTFGNDSQASGVNHAFILLASVFPAIIKIPNKRTQLFKKLSATMGEISNDLLIRSRREKDANMIEMDEEKSIIGLLLKSEGQDAELHMSEEEVVAQVCGDYDSHDLQADILQMKVLLVAGYETTSVGLTWALIELSQHPDAQTRLREELLAFGADPTYDQLKANLPYLDAVVHEVLRIHPPIPEFTRLAVADDVIPLSEPVCNASGEMTDNIYVAKGTLVTVPAATINRSLAIWGPDAKEFKPERWLAEGGISGKAKEVQGHRHLLTFVDGPRTCLGKDFAIAEFKAVLLVLVKNFVFEMRDGPDTQLEVARGILPRPRVVGEDGIGVPLKVRRYE